MSYETFTSEAKAHKRANELRRLSANVSGINVYQDGRKWVVAYRES